MRYRKFIIWSTFLILLLSVPFLQMSSANDPWVYVADGTYAKLSGGTEPVVYSISTLDDINSVAAARFNSMANGLPPQNINPSDILPEPTILKLVSSVGRFYNATAQRGTFSIKNPYLSREGVKNFTLRQYGNRLFPDAGTVLANFALSPNERYYSFEDNGIIWVIDSQNLSVKQITRDDGRSLKQDDASKQNLNLDWATNPKWSPDSSRIAFEANRNSYGNGGGEIWVSNTATGEERQVYTSGIPFRMLGWVLKDRILIEQYKTAKPDLVTVDLKGQEGLVGAERELTALGSTGNKVAYTKKSPEPLEELFIMDLKSVRESRVKTPEKNFVFSKWGLFSPNDKYLATTLDNLVDGKNRVYIYDFTLRRGRVFTMPVADCMADNYIWLNNDTLLVNISKSGRAPQTWYLKVNG